MEINTDKIKRTPEMADSRERCNHQLNRYLHMPESIDKGMQEGDQASFQNKTSCSYELWMACSAICL